ncbi:MAG: hypothetical protein JWO09_3171 [Bacteroidetes bacterium]|nr:hypothetical protein [Bacteroidota bacterium]
MKIRQKIALLVFSQLSIFAFGREKEPIFKFPPTITFSNNFSASYIHYKNWKYSGFNNYSFLLRSNVNYDTVGNSWETHLRFNGELGYMKFVDSTWYKNSDYMDLSADVIKNTNKTFENIFSFYFSSQFLSTYEMYYNDSGYYAKRWSSGFGNPMNIDIGYGTTIHFWKTCRANLTFVTFRTSTMPILEPQESVDENDLVYKRTLITSEYGLGIQTYIRKNIGKRVRWENYSRAFANAINRDKFDIDFRNRVIVKIFKCLDLIVDSRIRYMPYPPYKFQFRNEIMLSLTLEKM